MADRESLQWMQAEDLYSEIQSAAMFSIFGVSPTLMGSSPEETDEVFRNILEVCPSYYPAWFHRGEYMLRVGKNGDGESYMEKGFNFLAETVEDEEEFGSILFQRVEALEKLLRYDLIGKYLERAIRIFPENGTLHDELAFYLLKNQKPDTTNALRYQTKALELDPDNEYFINNLGWVYLMMGNHQEAEEHFERAIAYDHNLPGVIRNRDAARYMRKHKLSYAEFLVRPVDHRELKEMKECRDLEELEEIVTDFNADRMEAFKRKQIESAADSLHPVLDTLKYIELFLESAEETATDEEDLGFLIYDDLPKLNRNIDIFLFNYIYNSELMDQQFFIDTANALKGFYQFFRDVNLVSPGDFQQFSEIVEKRVPEMAEKIDHFLELRHDVTLTEDERETTILNLFGMNPPSE